MECNCSNNISALDKCDYSAFLREELQLLNKSENDTSVLNTQKIYDAYLHIIRKHDLFVNKENNTTIKNWFINKIGM